MASYNVALDRKQLNITKGEPIVRLAWLCRPNL
jgi:hypothetical protein